MIYSQKLQEPYAAHFVLLERCQRALSKVLCSEQSCSLNVAIETLTFHYFTPSTGQKHCKTFVIPCFSSDLSTGICALFFSLY